jgi:hypothetical protein
MNTDTRYVAEANQVVLVHDGKKVISKTTMPAKTIGISRLKVYVGTPNEVDAEIARLNLTA